MATPPDNPKPCPHHGNRCAMTMCGAAQALSSLVDRVGVEEATRRLTASLDSPATSRPASPEPTGTTREELAAIVAEEMERPFTHGRIPTDEERRAMREARAPLYRALAEGPDSTPASLGEEMGSAMLEHSREAWGLDD